MSKRKAEVAINALSNRRKRVKHEYQQDENTQKFIDWVILQNDESINYKSLGLPDDPTYLPEYIRENHININAKDENNVSLMRLILRHLNPDFSIFFTELHDLIDSEEFNQKIVFSSNFMWDLLTCSCFNDQPKPDDFFDCIETILTRPDLYTAEIDVVFMKKFLDHLNSYPLSNNDDIIDRIVLNCLSIGIIFLGTLANPSDQEIQKTLAPKNIGTFFSLTSSNEQKQLCQRIQEDNQQFVIKLYNKLVRDNPITTESDWEWNEMDDFFTELLKEYEILKTGNPKKDDIIIPLITEIITHIASIETRVTNNQRIP